MLCSSQFRDNLEKVKNIYQDEFEKLKEENEAAKAKVTKAAIDAVKDKVRKDSEKTRGTSPQTFLRRSLVAEEPRSLGT